MHKGFSVSGAPFFGVGLADPRPGARQSLDTWLLIFGTLKTSYGALRKGPPFSWVAKLKGDTNSECKLSNGRSAKLQGDRAASLDGGNSALVMGL